MTDESLVVPPRNYADVARLQEPTILDQFLDNPTTAALEAITGAFANGGKGMIVSAGRIAQGLVKGQFYEALAEEIRTLREKGKLPDDLGKTKHGLYTWAELMKILDEECPDADRLEALKAMFYAVNKVTADDKEQVLAYQLWHIAKQMKSGELLLLRTIYLNRQDVQNNGGYAAWANLMAEKSGLQVRALVDLYEKTLADFYLISQRQYGDGSGIISKDGRLTDLGLQFCKNIETYHLDLDSTDGD